MKSLLQKASSNKCLVIGFSVLFFVVSFVLFSQYAEAVLFDGDPGTGCTQDSDCPNGSCYNGSNYCCTTSGGQPAVCNDRICYIGKCNTFTGVCSTEVQQTLLHVDRCADGCYQGSCCANACTPGARRCSGNTVQECRNTDADPCTDGWVNITTCAANSYYCSGNSVYQTNRGCSSGACYDNPDTLVATCQPNSTYCSGNSVYQTNSGCSSGACYDNPDTLVATCQPNSTYCSGNSVYQTNSGCSGGACYDNPDALVTNCDSLDSCSSSQACRWVDYSCSSGACTSSTSIRTSCTGLCSAGQICTSAGLCNTPPTARNLSVNAGDYCTAPLRPIFSWTFSDADSGDTQSAYRLQINDGAVLDTGKVISTSNSYAVPAPSPLSYNTNYTWRVMVWDNKDTASGWAGSSFSTPPHAYPNVKFTWTPAFPTVGEVVTFTSNSICYGLSGSVACQNYRWEFGDGDVKTGPMAIATNDYPAAGSYPAQLRATDPDGNSCETAANANIVPVQRALPKWREIPPFGWIINALVALANGLFN